MESNRLVKVDELRLSVFDEGQGETILFVHGFPLDHSMWRAQRSACGGRRMIAPDLRGFGGSNASSDPTSMDRFAADLHVCLDELKVTDSVVYVGLSMGGYIAWPFLKQRPGRIRALVLANTRVVADTPSAAATRLENAEKVLRQGVQTIEASMLDNLFSNTTKQENPEAVENAGKMIRRAAPQGVALALLGMAARPDVSDRLSAVTIPTLVIAGAEDAIVSPSEMEGFARAIPGAEFVRVEGAGHMTPMENPPEFNNALTKFLRRVTD